MPKQATSTANADHEPCEYSRDTVAHTWYFWFEADKATGAVERQWFAGGQTSRFFRAWKTGLLARLESEGAAEPQCWQRHGPLLDARFKRAPRTPGGTAATAGRPPEPPRAVRAAAASLIDGEAAGSEGGGSERDSSLGQSTADFFTDRSESLLTAAARRQLASPRVASPRVAAYALRAPILARACRTPRCRHPLG